MSLFGSAPAASASSTNTQGDLSKDVAINQPPEDTVTDLVFSPAAEILAVSSWDKKVRVYEIDNSGQSQGKHAYDHEAPVFSVDFSKDGTKLVSAGADKQAKLCDLGGNLQTQQVAAHDAPIKCAKFFESPQSNSTMLVTGSWDKTIKYWDLRQSTPVGTVTAQERIYSMDVRNNLLVVGTADRYINVVNLQDPLKFYKTLQSPLKWQTRVEKDATSNFSFKCHRDPPQGNITNVYSVNDISFHPQHGTFSTAGSDGTFHFWDKDAKHRLKGYPTVGGSIVATTFNASGSIFAYAVGYDWSKGHQGNNAQYPNKVMLHPVQGDECKPRPSVKKR
ncbi:Poly(A)+ RNA export protein [Apiospora kogelbergensis]|uniref:Poly(A)+ RNA export protein n=1 Tax=Apiospora kogelbergensis TaxID=1337665 RepID=UPI00313108FC